jgi:DNA-binding response OmpR family regulator
VPKILLVDDSPSERAIVSDRLVRGGYDVVEAEDGKEALRLLFETRPDLVLLDVVMPRLDGWGTLTQIRDVSDVPVIMLTARDSELERVMGLRNGADDYVGKPFGPLELVARVEAVLRRVRAKQELPERYDDGTVTIDFASRGVSVGGEPVSLTPLEFRLLVALTEHADEVLSPRQLLDLVWRADHSGGRDEVKLYVSYLRRKLPGGLIETVRGFGYRYRRPG